MKDAKTKNGLEQFNELSEQLSREIKKLKQQVLMLSAENVRLKSELDAQRSKSALFDDMPEKQKMVLKEQIGTLIERIDKHLESE
jgi:regulator of replication initiation timing